MPDVLSTMNPNTDAGRAMLDAPVTKQASIIAYQNDFKLLMYMTLATLPLLLVLGVASTKKAAPASKQSIIAHALD